MHRNSRPYRPSEWIVFALAGFLDQVLKLLAMAVLVCECVWLTGIFSQMGQAVPAPWEDASWKFGRGMEKIASEDVDQISHQSVTPVSRIRAFVFSGGDAVGWIQIPETHIDNPVVRGEDDVKYLNHDYMGQYSLAGSVFMEAENSRDFSDPVSMLYGHNMTGDLMFSDVNRFLDPEYFVSHPKGTLYTREGAGTVTFLACLQVDACDTAIYLPQRIQQGQAPSYLCYCLKLAGKDSARASLGDLETALAQLEEGRRLLVLSTCTRGDPSARTILLGIWGDP